MLAEKILRCVAWGPVTGRTMEEIVVEIWPDIWNRPRADRRAALDHLRVVLGILQSTGRVVYDDGQERVMPTLYRPSPSPVAEAYEGARGAA